MIVVTGTMTLDPAKVDDARQAMLTMMEASNAESGCLSYRFAADLTEPGTFHLIEQWEDDAAMEAHGATPHMAELMSAMGTLGVTAAEIWRHDVSGTSRIL